MKETSRFVKNGKKYPKMFLLNMFSILLSNTNVGANFAFSKKKKNLTVVIVYISKSIGRPHGAPVHGLKPPVYPRLGGSIE